MTELLLEARALARRYRTRRGPVDALAGVDLALARGELVLVRGASGSGKTTLLLALGGLLRPSAGRVLLGGEDLYALSSSARRRARRGRVGFVFQTMHLLPYLDAAANAGLGGDGPRGRALLEELGLGGRAHHRPDQLSAGERQRVALARALAPEPELVLADEPTGNLDPASAALVAQALAGFHARGGTVVLVTHSERLALSPSRELRLGDGRLVG